MTTLGIYMTVSLLVIVAALIEFAVVLIIQHSCGKIQHQDCRSGNKESTIDKKEQTKIEDYINYRGKSYNGKEAWMRDIKSSKPATPIHETIDRACFGIFPTVYIVFNAIYWAYYGMI